MRPITRLIRWYDAFGRKLPWRRTRDPYRILVSEIMLQQTQVERVKGYYKAWLKRFPTFQALAKASNAEVLELWAGLGYNRRALALRDIARQVVERGRPSTREEWQALKGIGPYTSAAIAAFAHKQAVLPIDTNIRRALGRMLLGIHYPQLSDDARIEVAVAQQDWLRHDRAYDAPQALFDLATMHCTKVPDCARCPMQQQCTAAEAFLAGEVEPPKRMTPKQTERVRKGKRYPDRIYRGRILKVVRDAPGIVPLSTIGPQIDHTYTKQDLAWVKAMVERMVKDGLVKQTARGITV